MAVPAHAQTWLYLLRRCNHHKYSVKNVVIYMVQRFSYDSKRTVYNINPYPFHGHDVTYENVRGQAPYDRNIVPEGLLMGVATSDTNQFLAIVEGRW